MAAFKYGIARGQRRPAVTVAAGDTVGTDTIRVNFDIVNMTREQALAGLVEIRRAIVEGKWPPL